MRFPPLLILILTLIACEGSNTGQRYLDVSLGQPLEVPPDLARFEAESTFDLPQGFSGDDQAVRDKVPVLAKVDTLQLQGSGDFYWLSVEEPVENLYQQVKNFWALEGYGLVVDEPVIGIMQTEWIYKEEGGQRKDLSWWEVILESGDYAASQDQFKTRIERDPTGRASNRVYIAHRGTEFVPEVRVGSQKADDVRTGDWYFRRSEPELEIEMLSRLMIFLGLQKAEVDMQLSQTGLFKPRAFLEFDADEKSPYLVLRDPYHIAWNRVHHLLQRMNFEIVLAEFTGSLSADGAIAVNAEIVETAEKTGFFAFGEADKRVTRRFKLILSEETKELTHVSLKDEKGDFDTSPEGAEFLSLLFEQIK
ncbi:outer membrane protein assembly factor BamC [Gammaproteobacteria bacterium]|nr:outer membrane protein assembly factor BamC [Gammaproteobacteria bacterium]